MKYIPVLILLILSLNFQGCKKSSTSSNGNSSSSNITIGWLGNTSDGIVQYERIYTNGLLLGLRFPVQFEILDGSGEITITMTLVEDGDDVAEREIVRSVNPQERYEVTATVNFENPAAKSCGYGDIACKLVFSSPSAGSPRENTVLNWVNDLGSPYCVDVLTITDTSIDGIF
jgi:hypothetical protein